MSDPHSIDWNKALEDIEEHFRTMANAVDDIKDRFNPVPSNDPVYGEAWEVERERLREERWHTTYNAALPEAMREATDADEAHEVARVQADIAHGPLEVVVPAGSITPEMERELAKGGSKLQSGPGWASWNANIEALVKAAQTYVRIAVAPYTDEGNRVFAQLKDALKPFEEQT